MRRLTQRGKVTAGLAVACFLGVAECQAAGIAKSGQGNLTVSPTSVNVGSAGNYSFTFRAPRNSFNPGSQVTLVIPAGWPAPQTNSASGAGFIKVTPVLTGSAASLERITGAGPWTLTIGLSTSRNRGGFTIDYTGVPAPSNAGIYRFTAQSKQSGGVFKTLKSGSPTVTVNNPAKATSTTSVSSALNPSVYGDSVTFTASVSGSGPGSPTGTVTFRDGDVVIATVTLDAQGHASASTNRFSVPDSPAWITAEYSGNTNFNGSLSATLMQDVSPAPATLSGLAASNKVYDGNTNAALNLSGVSLGGVLPGDDVSLDISLAAVGFADPNVGTQKVVSVSGLALSGVDGDNYLVNFPPSVTASISPALLTVTANDTNRVFGAPNPTFTATYSGFVTGEDLSVLTGSPVFSTAADPASPVAGSPYPIVVSLGTLSAANYAFAFVPGWLTITPGPGQPPRILSITQLPDATVRLTCAGAAQQAYLLQAAPTLTPDSWTTLSTNTTDGAGSMTWIDPQTADLPSRFYRLALP
jgi:hypothetical protein